MFQITAETCRAFTFGEVLIMAAMNIESVRLSSEGARPCLTVRQRRANMLATLFVQEFPKHRNCER